jgi:MipA family protein
MKAYKNSTFSACLTFLLALVAPESLLAGELGAPPPAQDENGWIVTVRVMGAVAPSFPGSSQMRPYPFPSVSFRRVGEAEVFSTPDEGFGIALIDEGFVRAGPVANFVFKRGQRDGLFGLRRIGLTHEIGGFIEFLPIDHVRTRAELRQGIDGHEGFVAVLSADVYGSAGNGLSASIGPRFDLGDNRYANAYFSVSPVEAALNGRLTPYSATGGFTSVGGVATVRYDFTESASATLFGGLQRLTGSVGDSPIPNLLGSRNQFTAGLSIGRSFTVPALW